MKQEQKQIPQKSQISMNKVRFLIAFCTLLLPSLIFSQINDTLIIKFNNRHDEMRKEDFTHALQAGSPEEKLKRSIAYYITQMEPSEVYDSEFSFSHHNQSQKAYKLFGGKPPVILHKPKSFLKGKEVLDIHFFRTTPYLQVAKTFEEEDSWEEDVIIFMMDVDEMKNDSIILRQVGFTRPIKQ